MKEVLDEEIFGEEYCYDPIVGDSVTGDTPLFIKYNKTGLLDIIPIKEMINEESIAMDRFGREYDMSPKKFKVLCRSGWLAPNYLYRHKTSKHIYKITDKEKNVRVDCTEDHSLYNSKMEKIKPSQIRCTTKLEYYPNLPHGDFEIIPKIDFIYHSAYDFTLHKIEYQTLRIIRFRLKFSTSTGNWIGSKCSNIITILRSS